MLFMAKIRFWAPLCIVYICEQYHISCIQYKVYHNNIPKPNTKFHDFFKKPKREINLPNKVELQLVYPNLLKQLERGVW